MRETKCAFFAHSQDSSFFARFSTRKVRAVPPVSSLLTRSIHTYNPSPQRPIPKMEALTLLRDSPVFRSFASLRGGVTCVIAAVAIAVGLAHAGPASLSPLHTLLLALGSVIFLAASLASVVMSSYGDSIRTRLPTDPDQPYSPLFIFVELMMNPSHVIPVLTRHIMRAKRSFRIREMGFFGNSVHFIKDESLVHAVLLSHAKSFEKCRTHNEVYGDYSVLDGGESEHWARGRHALTPFFRLGIAGLQPQLTEIVSRHVAEWRRLREFDLLGACFRIVYAILFQAFFNYKPSPEELSEIMSSAEYFISMPNMATSAAKAKLAFFHERMRECLDGAPVGTLGATIKELVAAGEFTQQEAHANVGMLFLAITPIFAVFWNIVSLAAAGRMIQTTCLEDDTFMEMCIKETLRLYPPVPNMYLRECVEAVDLGHTHIRKGDKVVIFPLWVHQNPELWIEPSAWLPVRFDSDPHLFEKSGAMTSATGRTVSIKSAGTRVYSRSVSAGLRPRRENEATQPGKVGQGDHISARFIPFGLGKHMCLGRHFALMIIKTVLTGLLSASVVTIVSDNGLLALPIEDRLLSSGAAYFFPSRKVTVRLTSRAVLRTKAIWRSLAKTGLLASKLRMISADLIADHRS